MQGKLGWRLQRRCQIADEHGGKEEMLETDKVSAAMDRRGELERNYKV